MTALAGEMDGVSDRIGATDDSDGSQTAGSVMAKQNKTISDISVVKTDVTSVQGRVDEINSTVGGLKTAVDNVLKNQGIGNNVITTGNILANKTITGNSATLSGDICSLPVIMFGAGKEAPATLHGSAIPIFISSASTYDYNTTGLGSTTSVIFTLTIRVYTKGHLLSVISNGASTGIPIGKGTLTYNASKNVLLPPNVIMNDFKVSVEITSNQKSWIMFTKNIVSIESRYAYPFAF